MMEKEIARQNKGSEIIHQISSVFADSNGED